MPDYRELGVPRRGLSEEESFEEQPELTTREADNVRMIDPKTGRGRLSQRAGTTDHTTTGIDGSNKVKAGTLVVVDRNQTTYSEFTVPGDVVEEWSQATPSGRDCSGVQVDRQSNVWALDGLSSLVQYNSEGREVLRFNFPAEGASDEIRAFRVDSFDQIYAGVSTGTDQENARLWSYVKDEDEKLRQLWELNTGAYIEDLAFNEEETLLYTIQNDVDRWEAWLRVYQAIGTTAPSLAWERQIPYPCNALAVKPDGSALVACESFASRGLSPSGTGTIRTIDWTPRDLVDYSERIHCWLDAEDLSELYEDGDEVTSWFDKSGNGRNVAGTPGSSPAFVASDFAGRPAVRFTGADSQSLSSAPGFATSANLASSQKNLLPGTTGSGWCLFMAVRPHNQTDVDCFLSQSESATTTPFYVHMWSNATAGTGIPPALNAGQITARIQGATGGPAGGQAGPGSFANDSNIAIITLYCDNVGGTDTAYFRVNGNPIDNYNVPAVTSIDATNLGFDGASNPVGSYFTGDILEMIVLHDYDPGTGRTIVEIPDYPDVASDPASDTEVERFEGYLAHKWAVADELDDGEPSYPHPYELANGAPTASETGSSVLAELNNTGNLLAKFGATNGDPKWVIANDSDNPNATGATGVGGLGYGVAVTSDGEVFSAGPTDSNDASTDNAVRKIVDTGDSFDLEEVSGAVGPWSSALPNSATFTYKHLRLAVDTFDNVYVPLPAAATTGSAFRLSDEADDGNPASSLALGDGTGQDDVEARAVDVFPDVPDYGDDDVDVAEFVAVGTENDGGEAARGFIYIVSQPTAGDSITISDGQGNTDVYEWDTSAIAGSITVTIGGDTATSASNLAGEIKGGSSTVQITATALTSAGGDVDDGVALVSDNVGARENQPLSKTEASAGDVELRGMSGGSDADTETATVQKLRQVDTTFTAGDSRATFAVAVAGGTIADVTTAGAPVTLNSSLIDSGAAFISTAILFEKIYVTDGASRDYFVVDMKPATPTVEAYESTDGGKPPSRCALISSWRERLVFLRPADDPHLWHMSAAGNPLNNDIEPAVVTPASAISGTQTERAGLCPDIINAFVPYSNDIAIFGCDHSIYLMRGDPQADGQFDRVSDTIGMAFGRSWAKDPAGFVYFFGAQGGVHAMAPNGAFSRLSERRIERQLQEVDLGLSYIELIWDYRREGLMVIQTAQGAGGTVLNSWFWDKKHDFWARDFSSTAGVQPSTAFIFDGDDPDDRTVFLGCEDGIIRKIDEDATNDGTQAIASSCVLGPYRVRGEYETRMGRLVTTLASQQDGLRWEVYATDNPEDLGTLVRSGEFGPGRAKSQSAKCRGAYLYVRLANFSASQRWSLERVAAQLFNSGRRLVR